MNTKEKRHRLDELTDERKQQIVESLEEMAQKLDILDKEVGDVEIYMKVHSFRAYAYGLRNLQYRVLGKPIPVV